jgi:hypothetical protein
MSNNGREYTFSDLADFFKINRIIYEISPPYRYELNKIAERFYDIIVIIPRAIRSEAGLRSLL